MPRKPKFKPVITRIRLNPEQAVLICSCWDGGLELTGGVQYGTQGDKGCKGSTKNIGYQGLCTASGMGQVWNSITTKTAAS
jgi:hypothetical protein